MPATPESRSLQHRLCGFGLFLLFLGVVGVAGIQVGKTRVNQVTQWPSTTGRIVTSELTTSTVKTGRVLKIDAIAKIIYTYSVNGKSYRSEGLRVVPMLHFKPEGTPEKLLAKYPVGKSVNVYYDPNKPDDALLTPVAGEDAHALISSVELIAPIVAGVGLLIAGMAGVKLWRTRPATPAVSKVASGHDAMIEKPKLVPPPVAVTLTAKLPREPSPPRKTHWLVRGAATIFGLALLLFGSLVTVTVVRMKDTAVSGNMQIVMLTIFGGVILFGTFLVWLGMRQPRISTQSA